MRHLSISLLIVAGLFIVTSCSKSVQKYQVLISAIPNKGGTVSPKPDTYTYKAGTKLKLVATPSDHWKFDHWSGDVQGTSSSLTATIDSAMHIIANFSKKLYDLTVNIEGKGNVYQKIIQTNSSSTEDYKYGTVVQLTAKPNKGWKFVKWKGDLSGSQNPANITVKQPKEVTAVFHPKKNSLIYLGNNGVTIKCPKADFGDLGVVNGVTYTKRRRSQITPQNAATTCTSGITDMSNLFEGKTNFNADISSWDVSNVTNMSHMFDMTTGQQATNRRTIIRLASMSRTAAATTNKSAFNQPIGHWDVSNVTDMSLMFAGADVFNQPIGNWDVSSVKNMAFMFQKAKSFNQPIGHWDVSNVRNMSGIFNVAISFNQPIDNWDVSNAVKMLGMFAYATSFNKPISHWDVSNVVTMNLMFWGEPNFNQPIGKWDVSNVRDMSGMFKKATSFNQPIGNWRVFNVENMDKMFLNATSFNRDISSWCVTRISTQPTSFATGSPLTQAHIPQWGTCNVQANGITDARLTQSTQNPDHSVPMVAGRDAALLVFFDISIPQQSYIGGHRVAYDKQGGGKFNYDVTAKLFNHGSMVKKITVQAGTKALLPLSTKRAIMSLSVPGKYIKPGLSVKVKISNGWSYNLNNVTVKKVSEFHVRLIPIHVTATDKTGDVNEQNKDEYMEAALDLYPINDYIVDVHSPLNVSADPTKLDQGDFYGKVLNQVHATWVAEGDPDYYYYGVIPQSKGGTVGLGYVDNPQPHNYRQAVGWDHPGWQYRSETMAHEMGHNMGRNHAPCGNPSGVDPNYPYPNASIGVYGYEVDKGELKDPDVYHDLMSYCAPYWISDYTYKGVLKFRSKANSTTTTNPSSRDVLLVWGQISNNELVLEPAFRIKAPVTMPRKPGPYTLSGYDENGKRLFSFSFAGARVADIKNTRQFAFTIPVNHFNINALQTIQLSGRSLKAMQQTNIEPQAAQMRTKTKPQVAARRVNTNTVSVQWNNSKYQMALVKNAQTGEVIGFTSNGVADISSQAPKLKIYFSDGVKTVTKIVNVK